MFGAAVATGEWWRLLTAPFLHAGLWHVGINMIALWVLGGLLEPLLGRWRFVSVYLVSALAGAVASYTFGTPLRHLGGCVRGGLRPARCDALVAMRRLNRDVSGVLVLLVINVVLGIRAAQHRLAGTPRRARRRPGGDDRDGLRPAVVADRRRRGGVCARPGCAGGADGVAHRPAARPAV
jgi:hypothetical protein